MIFSWFKRFVIERSHASFRSGSVWRIKFKTILMHCTGLVRFAVSHKVLKHLRWYFALYAGRSSKLTPSFILNLVSFFTLHWFLSLSITLWYCMVISLVSPWCYLKPCTFPLYEIEGLNLVALNSDDNGPGSWGSYDGLDSWEVMHERFFGLQNVE